MHPWLEYFHVSNRTFLCSPVRFFGFNLIIGETTGEVRKIYSKKSAFYTIVVVLTGALLLFYGFLNKMVFVQDFLASAYSLSAVSISALLLIPLWKAIKEQHSLLTRFYAGLQILLVIFAAVNTHFPNLIITSTGEINMMDETAPDSVIQVLGISLIIGGGIILPGLFHLMKSFNMIRIPSQEPNEESE